MFFVSLWNGRIRNELKYIQKQLFETYPSVWVLGSGVIRANMNLKNSMPPLASTIYSDSTLVLQRWANQKPFQDLKLWGFFFKVLSFVTSWRPDFQDDPQEMLMNPYSEIDIARGSTLIILITSSHFRMTHTWTPFPGHYEHVKSHCCSPAPSMPWAKGLPTIELSKSQAWLK